MREKRRGLMENQGGREGKTKREQERQRQRLRDLRQLVQNLRKW